MQLNDLFPPAGVSVRCGGVELRCIGEGDLPALVEVALAGVHDPGFMPFAQPWTQVPRAQLPINTARWLWQRRAECLPEDWNLNFGVFTDGEVCGVQELSAKDFVHRRVAETGSWLGQRFQGRGLGTLARQLAVALAFDGLGAVECRSGAFADNQQSLSVSRKVGYRVADTTRESRADDQGWGLHHTLVVTPDTFVRPEERITFTGVEEFRAFVGLQPVEGATASHPPDPEIGTQREA